MPIARRSVHIRAARSARPLSSTRGSHAAHAASRRVLPRDDTRRRRLRDLPRQRRPPRLPLASQAKRRAVRLDDLRPLPHDDALPPRPPLHARRALKRAPTPERPLRAGVQRTPWPVRTLVRRPLHVTGHRRRDLPLPSLPLRRREPRSRRSLRLTGGLALVASPRRATDQTCGPRTSRPRPRKAQPAPAREFAPCPPPRTRRDRDAARGRRARASPPS